MKRSRYVVAGSVAALVACVIVVLTVTPTPIDRGIGPLLSVVVRAVASVPGLEWFDLKWLERSANVIMFLPFGGLLALVFGRGRRWFAPIVAGSLSLLVELVQYIVLPERTASMIDVLMNTAGAGAGALIVTVASRRRPG